MPRQARHHPFDTRHNCPCRGKSGRPRASRELRVSRAERPPAGADLGTDLTHVGQSVNRKNLVFGCWPWRCHCDSSQLFKGANALEDCCHALRTFWMTGARLVVQRRGVVEHLRGRRLSYKRHVPVARRQPGARTKRSLAHEVATTENAIAIHRSPAPNRQYLCWRVDDAELLQKTKLVEVVPAFD